MSNNPTFDREASASTIYENGIPMLEQGGERFTFSEHNSKAGTWTPEPRWLPKGMRRNEELTAAVDKLLMKLDENEKLIKETRLMFASYFAAVERVAAPMVDLARATASVPWDDKPVISLEEKKIPPAVKPIRKRAPRRKKSSAST